MRIPLKFDVEKTRVYVLGSVRFPQRSLLPVSFIIDTGSPVTFVDEFTSARVRIFANNLPFDHEALMGGAKIGMYRAGAAEMSFLDNTGSVITLPPNDIMIAKTEWTRRSATYTASSIIGLDFLLKNKAHLFVEPHSDTAYIEML